MEQGSTDWLAWRSKGIGGSDAPIIMGVSPWKTPYELWREKTAKATRSSLPNFQQQRGIDLEPKARARYELFTDIEAPPALFEHPEFPHFRVSLDGWNEARKVVLEIKCPGREDHAKAKAGEVPEKYIYQLEMQLWVAGGTEAHYFSYTEDKKGAVDTALVVYKSVPERKEKMINALHKFWDCVVRDVPPALSDKDAMVLEDLAAKDLFAQLGELERRLQELYERADKIEGEKKELKERAARFVTHPRVRCGDVEIIKRTRKGSIDYSKVPDLAGVDVEKFRNPEITYFEVKLIG